MGSLICKPKKEVLSVFCTNGKPPQRNSKDAAGYDVTTTHDLIIPPGKIEFARTGIHCCPPEGTYIRTAARSSIGSQGLVVPADVIDADYTGEITFMIWNTTPKTATIPRGCRIGQLILERISTPPVLQVDALSNTIRGSHGIGSTNKQEEPTASFE